MLAQIKRFFTPSTEIEEEKLYLVSLLNVTLFIVLFGIVVFIIASLLGGSSIGVLSGLAVGLITLLSLGLVRQGNLLWPSIFVPTIHLILVTILVSRSGGTLSDGLIGYGVVLVLAAMLLGRRGLVIFTLLVAGCVVGIKMAEVNGVISGNFSRFGSWDNLVDILFVVILMAVFLFALIGYLSASVNQARRNAQILTEKNRELLAIQATLEQRVVDRTRRLQLAAALSEQLSAILDIDQLLNTLVKRVREVFGYYHVQVYLTQPENSNLVLSSGTGEAAQIMLAQKHSIPIGQGIVGRAAQREEAVLATNLSPIIAPEVVTANNIDAVYHRERDDRHRREWYRTYIRHIFGNLDDLAADRSQIRLGYVMYDMGDFAIPILQGIRDAAGDLHVDVDIAQIPYDTQPGPLLDQFKKMLNSQQLQGMVVVPQAQFAWPATLKQADEAGVPVVTANLTGPDIADRVWFGQDGYQGGFALAVEFKQHLQAAGYETGRIAAGISGTTEAGLVARYQGFKDGLAGTEFRCSALFNSNTIDPQEDYQAWTDFLNEQSDFIAAVGFTAFVVPILSKIKADTNGDWLIAGFDLEGDTMTALKSGLAQVTVAQHPYLQGYLAVLALTQNLRQGKPLQDWVVKGWLPNPLLPETKSEVSVPILLEGRVEGVLDIQSDKVYGLDEGDAGLLRTLANQVAITIRNARQFTQVRQALANAEAVQSKYVEQTWDKRRLAQQVSGRVEVQFDGASRDTESANTETKTLTAPITLRNIIIGRLQLESDDPNHIWSEREEALINAVVDQIALAADNVRLFEETRQRAARERLIGQIGDKMRSAPNIEALMEIGVTELSKILNPARTFVHFGSQAELTEQEGLAEAELNSLDVKP